MNKNLKQYKKIKNTLLSFWKGYYNEGYSLETLRDRFIDSPAELEKYSSNIELELQRLERLDNLQEEIGCPLDVMFKALKQPIYSKHPKTSKLCCIICPTFYFSGNQWLIGCHSMEWNEEEMCCDSWDCFPKDYKKTWWLKKDKSE